MYLVIVGLIFLVIGGLDMCFDYDKYTLLWLLTGYVQVIIGHISIAKGEILKAIGKQKNK